MDDFSGWRPRAAQSTSDGDLYIAGSIGAKQARARVCWCTSAVDLVAGEAAAVTLHLPSKPERSTSSSATA